MSLPAGFDLSALAGLTASDSTPRASQSDIGGGDGLLSPQSPNLDLRRMTEEDCVYGNLLCPDGEFPELVTSPQGFETPQRERPGAVNGVEAPSTPVLESGAIAVHWFHIV